MNHFNLILTFIAGIIFLVWGIFSQFSGFVRWWVSLINSLKGVKTEITRATFLNYRIGGILLILVGLVFIIFFFYIKYRISS